MRYCMSCGKELSENFGVPICDGCFEQPLTEGSGIMRITPEEREMRAKTFMVTPEQRKASARMHRYVPSENPFKW